MVGQDDIVAHIEQLFTLLQSWQRLDVRLQAIQLLAQFIAAPGVVELLDRTPRTVQDIVHLIQPQDGNVTVHSTVVEPTIMVLVEVAVCDAARRTMIHSAVVRALVSMLDFQLLGGAAHPRTMMLTTSLLANLSRDEEACIQFFKADRKSRIFSHLLRRLFPKEHDLEASCMEKSDDSVKACDSIAHFVTNVSALSFGRDILFSSELGVVQQVVARLENESTERKCAFLRILRNLAFVPSKHELMLSEEVGLLAAIVRPLAGPEPIDAEDLTPMLPAIRDSLTFDKVREADPDVRRLAIEIIDVLVRVKSTRLYLRSINIYHILRELHLWEENTETQDYLENVVQWFIDDEVTDF